MFSTSKIRLSMLSIVAAAALALGMAGPASAHHKTAKHVSVHVVKQSSNGGAATGGNGGAGGAGGASGAVVAGAGAGPVGSGAGGGGGAGGAGAGNIGGAGGINTNTGDTITSTDNSVHATV